jgi:hypothetical protein
MRAVGIAGVALLLSAAVLSITAAGVFRELSPSVALTFAPWDPRASARLAQQSLLDPDARRSLETIADRARSAVEGDPLATEGVTTLAMVADLQGQRARAAGIFSYAERLSRREVETQMWLIEYNVQRNDIRGALTHYNVVLSTSPDARPALMAILISASSHPDIAAEVNRVLLARPNWKLDFLTRFTFLGHDPAALAAVSRQVLDPAIPEERDVLVRVLTRYVALGAYDQAWETYHDAMGTAPGDPLQLLLRNGNFAHDPGLPPFDWSYPANASLVPERRPRQGANYAFALYLPASHDGDVEMASQAAKLAEGTYQLQAVVGDDASPPAESSRPFLRVSCVGEPQRELVTADFPPAQSNGQMMQAHFVVPAGCAFQRVSIWVRANPEGTSPSEPWISAISLRRL